MPNFTFVDLFAGIGGTRHAFEQEGGECVFSCEIKEEARDVYKENWGEHVTKHDIRDFEPDEVPSHDALLACWPCPSFSQLGKKEGLRDDRGNLFWKIVEILEAKQPAAFFLENVKNLLFINDGAAFRIISRALEDAGYTVFSEVLNALDFGLPQHRERLIIVGLRNDCAPAEGEFELPTETEAALTTEEEQRAALADILEDDPDAKYYASEKVQQDRRETVDDPDTVPEPSVWHENRHGGVKPRPYAGALRASGSWRYLLINGERNPTVRELLRLQGFPEWFDIDDSNRARARRLTGNTVPIPVVHAVATELLDEAELRGSNCSDDPATKRAGSD